MIRLGIDLGGTKIEIIALDANGNELLRRRVATPQCDYQATIYSVTELIHNAEKEIGERCTVGIGTPGAISRATGLLKNSNSVCLNGHPLLYDLESLLMRSMAQQQEQRLFLA